MRERQWKMGSRRSSTGRKTARARTPDGPGSVLVSLTGIIPRPSRHEQKPKYVDAEPTFAVGSYSLTRGHLGGVEKLRNGSFSRLASANPFIVLRPNADGRARRIGERAL